MIDTIHLVHYVLPNTIKIQLLTKEGNPFTEFSVPIMVDYGFYMPPLNSDTSGQVCITQELMEEAKHDHISTGIMDYKYDDYSLSRYVIIRVMDLKEGTALANGRVGSGWPISNLEKKLHGSMERLAAAFIPLKDINSVEKYIDLSQGLESVKLDINIIVKE